MVQILCTNYVEVYVEVITILIESHGAWNRLGMWVIIPLDTLFYPFVVVSIGMLQWDWHLPWTVM